MRPCGTPSDTRTGQRSGRSRGPTAPRAPPLLRGGVVSRTARRRLRCRFGGSALGPRVVPYTVQPSSVVIALQSVVGRPSVPPNSGTGGAGILEHETTSLLLRRSMLEASADSFSGALQRNDWSTGSEPRESGAKAVTGQKGARGCLARSSENGRCRVRGCFLSHQALHKCVGNTRIRQLHH